MSGKTSTAKLQPQPGDTDGSPPVRCTLCGSPRNKKKFEKSGYDHFACHSCTGLFVFPTPSRAELTSFYRQSAEDAVSTLCWSSSRRHLWDVWDWSLGLAQELCGRGPLLDVGCGAGQFLEFALRRDWPDVTGLELSPVQADVARRRTGATIHEADLLEADLPAGLFAVLTLWDVIEHVPDPLGFVRAASRLLAPGGVLILSTANRRGISMRIWGRHALVVMPPEHLSYHTRRSMRRLLELGGMELKAIRCTHVYLREWLRWPGGSRRRAGGADASYLGAYERLVGSKRFLGGMRLANKLVDATRLGDNLVAVAQRPHRSLTEDDRSSCAPC